MAKTIGGGDKTDFDETRRLLYMSRAARLGTKKYNLAGTLTNALAHHHAVDGLDADEIMGHVIAVIDDGPGASDGEAFIRQQISRITAELGD